MIRLLIDECLSPALAKLANDRGIEATHLDAIETAGNDIVNQLVEVDADGRVTMSAWPFEGSNLPK